VSASFTPSQAGQYLVSVTFRGKHPQGSPFDLEMVDRPIYHRDYRKVSDKPASQREQVEQMMGNLVTLVLLLAI